jgi:hypothetical protein
MNRISTVAFSLAMILSLNFPVLNAGDGLNVSVPVSLTANGSKRARSHSLAGNGARVPTKVKRSNSFTEGASKFEATSASPEIPAPITFIQYLSGRAKDGCVSAFSGLCGYASSGLRKAGDLASWAGSWMAWPFVAGYKNYVQDSWVTDNPITRNPEKVAMVGLATCTAAIAYLVGSSVAEEAAQRTQADMVRAYTANLQAAQASALGSVLRNAIFGAQVE